MIAFCNRREWLRGMGIAASGLVFGLARAKADDPPKRKFTKDLMCGNIGVSASLPEAIKLAAEYGFESVGPDAGYLAKLSDDQLAELLADLKAKKLVWGGTGLMVDFRGDEETFKKGLAAMDKPCKALQRAGVTRLGTWLSPGDKSVPYGENLKTHADRFREIATRLADYNLRLGLEYVGPKTARANAKYPFIHTMMQTRELLTAIDRPNVGLLLDSWHWYTAHESEADLLQLKGSDVICCDLNDAPTGIPIDEQQDSKRDLPCATGVIDLKTFLNALVKIGYDGPVRAEPFKSELRSLPRAEALKQTSEAMDKAFALIG